MLEGFRLAAVCDRRRKTLLEKLEGLIGDTRKESPPSFEPKDEEVDGSKGGTLVRKDSKRVIEAVKDIEERHKEETPPPADSEAPAQEEEAAAEEQEEGRQQEEEEEEEEEDKKRTYSIHSFSSHMKKLFGRSTSPYPPGKDQQQEPPAPVPGEEEDTSIKLTSQMEKRTKKFGTSSWVKCTLTLREALVCVDKDKQVDLPHCTAMPSPNPCELELHQPKGGKTLLLRAESEELRNQWVEALQAAIQACSPQQEPAGEPKEEEAKEGMLW